MIIRKLYRFEAAHIVRDCSSERCRLSLHGHSFRCELLLTADRLDRGQMVYDFGLLKGLVGDFLDGFDHAVLFWEREAPAFRRAMKTHSARWVQLPVSPTAEQLARLIFVGCQAFLDATDKVNGDQTARVHSVILHETETGYAQCFRADVDAAQDAIDLRRVIWADAVKADWKDPKMWDKLAAGGRFKNPKPPRLKR
ncbi:MAG: 6-carboxytetrahydropterin synthase [Elusimicrobia bacterium]|nr:6-carboxytetrahydropterin synthase [Elusimicrobiota bacterium]